MYHLHKLEIKRSTTEIIDLKLRVCERLWITNMFETGRDIRHLSNAETSRVRDSVRTEFNNAIGYAWRDNLTVANRE